MRVIPVMDLKERRVVRAVGGRRDEYRPIQSRLVASSSPEQIARAFREQLGFDELYVADLDAIAGREPAWDLYRRLCGLNLRLIVDAGIRELVTARALQAAGVSGIVLGLETLAGPRLLAETLNALGPQRVWFSLDLNNAQPLGHAEYWPEPTAEAIVRRVVGAGVTKTIVLDLARIGERTGTGTEELCGKLIKEHPHLELVAGGGIRDSSDLRRLEAIGVHGALVATALHEGRIRREAVKQE